MRLLATIPLLLALLPASIPAAPPLLSEEVRGFGQSESDARQDAMSKARERILSLLRERQPDLRWEPTDAYLREMRLVRDMVHVPDVPSERVQPPLHRVTIRVEVTEQDLARMLQQDRLQQRHLLTAKVLVALVALLVVLAAFFRLEDVTRGYYTSQLRAGLSICLAVIAAGLWWLW